MLCHCSREQFKFEDNLASPEDMATIEMSSSGLSAKTIEGEAKLDEGNIQEAESSLREALSLNYEEARALLGRLEYQRGNIEGALQVFDGIDISTLIPRMKFSIAEKGRHHRGRPRAESAQPISMHASSLLLEAIYLKARSLQKLGRFTAAQECKSVLDTIEAVLPYGVLATWGEQKLQETINKAVELLPELLKQAGLLQQAISAYRRALLSPWNLDSECSGRIQKEFAVLLLYGGVEAGAPSLGSQLEGAFVPKNNLEEAILLLLILLRSNILRKVPWDHTVMEHLCFALSVCGQSTMLAQQFEETLPGVYARTERWYTLALCYSSAGEHQIALNFLRKALSQVGRPNDVPALLLAAKICANDVELASEGINYSQKAVEITAGNETYLKGRAYNLLGVAFNKQVNAASTDSDRFRIKGKALNALVEASLLEKEDPQVIFDLGLVHAEQGNLIAALKSAKTFLELSMRGSTKAWRFLALLLSAQQKWAEAEVVLDAALEETGKWEHGELLRTKAKLQIAQGRTMHAIDTYRLLLALVQAQRKSFGNGSLTGKASVDKVSEVEVWQDLAGIYTSLSQWHDAEICLEKAQALKTFSAMTWHATGVLHEARGQLSEAITAYNNALAVDPQHSQSKVSLGAALMRIGRNALPVARNIFSNVLHSEPTNHAAWYNLGIVHEEEGHAREAAECFQAALILEQATPIEKFSTLT
ncbi:hypothetical protein O6H91_17G007500 [Diphasiastrum complanatum]|uniref:Uncharacterized protein n=1 Tax=Diphasiastrum complanatum TaxID=34168 RepID=A0ACC2B402_DIPCM|nr:hypothetical protein O6H91_17G007500 [Diphasiastrum complanatum]